MSGKYKLRNNLRQSVRVFLGEGKGWKELAAYEWFYADSLSNQMKNLVNRKVLRIQEQTKTPAPVAPVMKTSKKGGN